MSQFGTPLRRVQPQTHPSLLLQPARYPQVPPEIRDHNRYYALGWPVDEDWLRKFASRTSAGAVNCQEGLIAHSVLQLRRLARFRHIYYLPVLPDGAPTPDDALDPGIPRQWIIAIAYTATKSMFCERPTKAKYEWLKSVFGREPCWYRDFNPKEVFWQQTLSRADRPVNDAASFL
ncbi:uncharacterized protein LAESUDRAFT_711386 [Laetiporus sulphureus 93-53]|uniref:Uncharacterized protein n=1 Tax=Laetiporus sulphureus 93-53 TaxID=1314785 RepID=A0A165GY70_9APHY|nr:uncharacterized protein LAESUDRAFT_711386 [Laetiporus sulphureus 93-53]KZT10988.1 hypothetical protein LAESUDRAFT_711386 [Laetiporus sulphureus 93-53]